VTGTPPAQAKSSKTLTILYGTPLDDVVIGRVGSPGSVNFRQALASPLSGVAGSRSGATNSLILDSDSGFQFRFWIPILDSSSDSGFRFAGDATGRAV
jgi:hypothetical protein